MLAQMDLMYSLACSVCIYMYVCMMRAIMYVCMYVCSGIYASTGDSMPWKFSTAFVWGCSECIIWISSYDDQCMYVCRLDDEPTWRTAMLVQFGRHPDGSRVNLTYLGGPAHRDLGWLGGWFFWVTMGFDSSSLEATYLPTIIAACKSIIHLMNDDESII